MGAVATIKTGEIIEAVITRGDIAKLSAEERAQYYVQVCQSVGLNPMTRPFEYITLNGKLTLYARKDCTDQLRQMHDVSVVELTESERDHVFIVTAKVQNAKGRSDAAKGAVNIAGLKGEALANAMMKAETKAKRRATLSICGLGFLDETEVDDIPVNGARAQTLPKKDARDIYTRLQQEIDTVETRDALTAWGKNNADRIKVLPEDWQGILRLRYQERMVDLQQREPAEPNLIEKPADPLEIPPELRRVKAKPMPNPANDIVAWLSWLDEKLAAVKSGEALETYWNDTIAPVVDQLFPPDQEEALGVFRRHEERLAP